MPERWLGDSALETIRGSALVAMHKRIKKRVVEASPNVESVAHFVLSGAKTEQRASLNITQHEIRNTSGNFAL